MGTRGLTCVVKDGKFRVAQYGQWDHYPTGQGKTILEFLQKAKLDRFAQQVNKCYFGSEEEVNAVYKKFTDKDGWMNGEQEEAFKASEFAHLTRDIGGDILEFIYDSDKPRLMLVDNTEFAADSLFCEWAYVVDLDKNTFEVYKGFQHLPVPEGQRFAFLNEMADKDNDEKQKQFKEKGMDREPYFPVHLLKVFDLRDLPSVEEFLAALEPEEDEDTDDVE